MVNMFKHLSQSSRSAKLLNIQISPSTILEEKYFILSSTSHFKHWIKCWGDETSYRTKGTLCKARLLRNINSWSIQLPQPSAQIPLAVKYQTLPNCIEIRSDNVSLLKINNRPKLVFKEPSVKHIKMKI